MGKLGGRQPVSLQIFKTYLPQPQSLMAKNCLNFHLNYLHFLSLIKTIQQPLECIQSISITSAPITSLWCCAGHIDKADTITVIINSLAWLKSLARAPGRVVWLQNLYSNTDKSRKGYHLISPAFLSSALLLLLKQCEITVSLLPKIVWASLANFLIALTHQ